MSTLFDNPTRLPSETEGLSLQYDRDHHEQMGICMGICIAIGVLCSLTLGVAAVVACLRVLLFTLGWQP